MVSVICLGVLYLLLRLVRSPFGHVLVAIRENQLRATFQGYPVERYKLVVFVISAVVTGFAGGLIGFQNYLVSAEAVSVPFSGELLAIVVIGGMRSMLGPALGALFFILFRELFSIWTVELAAVVRPRLRRLRAVLAGRPRRHLGDAGETLVAAAGRSRRDEPAQDLRGPAAAGLPAARRARTARAGGRAASRRRFGGIRAVTNAEPTGRRRRNPCADRAERRRQDHAVQPGLRPVPDRQRHHQAATAARSRACRPSAICHQGLARSFQITNLFKGLSIYENLRLSLQAQQRHAASTSGATSTATKKSTPRPRS